MEMKNNDTPRPMYDLNEERGKASFHPRALTFVLEGGEAKTQRREYFERLVEEVHGRVTWWGVAVLCRRVTSTTPQGGRDKSSR